MVNCKVMTEFDLYLEFNKNSIKLSHVLGTDNSH